MASILKVDELQKPNGAAWTAQDFGIFIGNGTVIQTVSLPVYQVIANCPHINNTRDNKTSIGYTLSITTTQPNSKILLLLAGSLTSETGSHTYFDVKRNGVWLNNETQDALWADHASANITSGFAINYLDTPNYVAGSTINYTFWLGDWGGGNVALNRYPTNNNSDGYSMFIAQEILNT